METDQTVPESRAPRGIVPVEGVPSIAVIGCGAISASFHVPGLVRHTGIRDKLILVDPDTSRARALGDKHGVTRVVGDYSEILSEVNGAVIAVPHNLHYPIALDCLREGVHVLCEKPLAGSAADARRLVQQADEVGALLAVNHTQRLYSSTQRVRELVRDGDLGRLKRIEISWGDVFDWPAESGFRFVDNTKGALFDQGAHALDLICWWVGGKPRVVSYTDDSFGGPEAVVELELEYQGCACELHLSWLSRLANTYQVQGESLTVQGEMFDWQSLVLLEGPRRRRVLRLRSAARMMEDFGPIMIDNFLAAMRGEAQPIVSGRDAVPTLELIEECYANRNRFDMPWHDSLERISRG